MKNLLTAYLPALALFALGGCAGTSAITSSEDDGVYYSSQDRTTAIVSTPPPAASGPTDEAANPDYYGGSSNSTARQNTGSDQYYDNTYTYMKGVPSYGSSTFYGPGLSYYTPYSAYTSLSYGWGGGACGFSPYAYGGYDPFYSSFYSPFGYGYSPYYGYGSGLSVSFGFGRPWGYGGYGYGGFGYSPYGYGYGSLYSPYYYNSPFYGGYYGRGGYYGNNYYGSSYGGGYNDGNRGNGRTYGRRADRGSDGRYPSGGVVTAPGGTTGPAGGGRGRSSELVAMPGGAGSPNSPSSMPNTTVSEAGRGRAEMREAAAGNTMQPTSGSYNNRPRRMDAADQPQYRNMDQFSNADANPNGKTFQGQGGMPTDNSRGRMRNTADIQPQSVQQGQMQPAISQPQEGRRRGGFFQSVLSEPSNNGGQVAQPRQQTYDQPRQRSFEQPQPRSYEQPQRSYSQPSYSQPSYSAPSYGGGGGGGNSGGGGGGGHSRGR